MTLTDQIERCSICGRTFLIRSGSSDPEVFFPSALAFWEHGQEHAAEVKSQVVDWFAAQHGGVVDAQVRLQAEMVYAELEAEASRQESTEP